MKKKQKQTKIGKSLDEDIPMQRGKIVIGRKPDGTLFHEAFYGKTIEDVDIKINEYMESLDSK